MSLPAGPPLVSVVITSYNYARFIRTAIDSVLAQDYPNFEVVVTDNQSTDDTLEVLKAYENDARVRVNVNPTNIHITPNINAGVRLCRGEYVVILSADDFLLPGHMRRLVEMAETHPELGVIYGNAYYADAAGAPYLVRNVLGQVPGDYIGGRNEFPWLMLVCYVCMPTILFRRTLFEAHGLFDERVRIACDWEICFRYAAAGEQFGYVSTPVADVRMHDNQHSTVDYIHSEDLTETLDLMERYLTKENLGGYHGYELRIRRSLLDRVERLTGGPKPENPAVSESPLRCNRRALDRGTRSRHRLQGPPRSESSSPAATAWSLLGTARSARWSTNHTNWEAIVVQSAGFTLEPYIATLAGREKIRFVRTTFEMQPGAARNIGLFLCDADYIAFLDEDDELAPDHFTMLLDAARSDESRLAASGTLVMFDEFMPGTSLRRTVAKSDGLHPALPQAAELHIANCLPLGAVLFEKSLTDQLQLFQEGFGVVAEWDYLFRAARFAKISNTGVRTFLQHAGIRLHGQYLQSRLSTYVHQLDRFYAAYPATSVEVVQARAGHRAQLLTVLAAPPRRLTTTIRCSISTRRCRALRSRYRRERPVHGRRGGAASSERQSSAHCAHAATCGFGAATNLLRATPAT